MIGKSALPICFWITFFWEGGGLSELDLIQCLVERVNLRFSKSYNYYCVSVSVFERVGVGTYSNF